MLSFSIQSTFLSEKAGDSFSVVFRFPFPAKEKWTKVVVDFGPILSLVLRHYCCDFFFFVYQKWLVMSLWVHTLLRGCTRVHIHARSLLLLVTTIHVPNVDIQWMNCAFCSYTQKQISFFFFRSCSIAWLLFCRIVRYVLRSIAFYAHLPSYLQREKSNGTSSTKLLFPTLM